MAAALPYVDDQQAVRRLARAEAEAAIQRMPSPAPPPASISPRQLQAVLDQRLNDAGEVIHGFVKREIARAVASLPVAAPALQQRIEVIEHTASPEVRAVGQTHTARFERDASGTTQRVLVRDLEGKHGADLTVTRRPH